MDTQKKIAAAMAAVMTYIKTEEENVLLPPPAPTGPSLWATGGKLEMMQTRSLMQLKAFK